MPGEVDVIRDQLESEARAARELLGRTRFPTPEPVALGAPGPDYPMPWSVQTWVPGTVATEADPASSVALAHDLADFIRDVRAIPIRGRTFRGSGRGGSLPDHDAWVETWAAATSSGRAVRHGHSSKPSARAGTTSTATRR
jgi:aminoglycoside phosphotransferase (APT) family kinase protein